MADRISPDRRSWNMSRIHGKDTSIEVSVRRWLFHKGYRFRKNVKTLPGSPDIVLRPYKTVIVIHGCFWHHHSGCKKATTPKTRTDFWQEKFDKNVANDIRNQFQLKEMGYNVIVLWECEIVKNYEEVMEHVAKELGPPRNNTNISKISCDL